MSSRSNIPNQTPFANSKANFDRRDPNLFLDGRRVERLHTSNEAARLVLTEAQVEDPLGAYENSSDLSEKITMVPFPVPKMSGLLEKAVDSLRNSGNNEQVDQDYLTLLLQTSMLIATVADPADNVHLNEVMRHTEKTAKVPEFMSSGSPQDLANLKRFEETMRLVELEYTREINQDPDLQQIIDNADHFSVDTEAHPYQRDRVANNPSLDFNGQPYGDLWNAAFHDGIQFFRLRFEDPGS